MASTDVVSWQEAVMRWASKTPAKTAFSFSTDGDTLTSALTFLELDVRARSLAHRLRREQVRGPVLLLYPTGPDYITAIFGCLYAGVTAIPAAVPSVHPRSVERLGALIADSGTGVVLSTRRICDRLRSDRRRSAVFTGLSWLVTDDLDPADADHFDTPAPALESVAILQYTSGSTTSPRGVMVTHGNLLANSRAIGQGFGTSPDTRNVSWLPVFHDMGLIGGVLQTVHCGGSSFLMPSAAFAEDASRWLKAISDTRATASGGPNFAYDRLIESVPMEERERYDLSSWEVAYCGAEPIRSETMRRFAEAFKVSGLRPDALTPCYGLAEATLMVSTKARGAVVSATDIDEMTRQVVNCGAPVAHSRVEVVEPQTGTRCTEGEVGEIWVQGPGVAAGYWDKPELNAELFAARLEGVEEPFLRTGDLGCVIGGELHITGRRKDMMVIRGRNHYPQDVEQTAESADPLVVSGGSAAFSVLVDGTEEMVIALEAPRHTEAEDLAAAARRVRVEVTAVHEISPATIVIVAPAALPRTTSGKIQRGRCREAYLAGELAARWTDTAPSSALATAVGPPEPGDLLKVLRGAAATALSVAPHHVSLTEPLVMLGLDSMALLRLSHEVRRQTGIELPVEDAMALSISELAAIGEGPAGTHDRDEPTAPVPVSGDFPMSQGQQSLWFIDRFAPANPAYIVAAAAAVSGPFEPEDLRRALAAAVADQAALRTIFPLVGDGPVQRVLEDLPAGFDVIAADGWDESMLADRMEKYAYQPFDLTRGPLLRVGVFTGADGVRLVVAVHHIVTDLWSMGVLVRELAARLASPAGAVPPAPATFAARAIREGTMLAGPEADRLWAHWRDRLAGAPAELALPRAPRPSARRLEGRSLAFTLPSELTERLRALSRQRLTTLNSLMLAAYQTLLARWGGEPDVLVALPVHGREADDEMVVGYFVNTVVVRGSLDGTRSFLDVLQETHGAVGTAVQHGRLPFGSLVERMRIARDSSRPPVVQASFSMYQPGGRDGAALSAFAVGRAGAKLSLGALVLESLPLSKPGAQFDVALAVADTGQALSGVLTFDVDLFGEETLDEVASAYVRLLAEIADAPQAPLATLGERSGLAELERRGSPAPAQHSQPAEIPLPYDHQRDETSLRQTERLSSVLDLKVVSTAGDLALENSLDPAPVLTAVYRAWLHQVCRTDTVTFAVLADPDQDAVTAVSRLPERCRFADLVAGGAAASVDERRSARAALVLAAPSPAVDRALAGLSADLVVYAASTPADLEITLEYDSRLFTVQTAGTLLAAFEAVAEHAIGDPAHVVEHLPLGSGPITRPVLGEPPQGSLAEAFSKAVLRFSDRGALTWDGQTWNYRELDQRAQTLADALRHFGVGPGDRVPMLIEPGPGQVVAILAVVRCGAAYVPIDTRHPAERVRFMVDDIDAAVMIASRGRPVPDGMAVVEIDHQGVPATTVPAGAVPAPVSRRRRPDDLAYVLYTSGSTGTPKGVQLEDRQVLRLFTALEPGLAPSSEDVWTLYHSYAFDVMVFEMWGALLHGGRLVVVPPEYVLSPVDYRNLMVREGVTVMCLTPGAFAAFLPADEAAAEPLDVRWIALCGEAASMDVIRRWAGRHSLDRPRVINLYGITETTVHTTLRDFTTADLGAAVAPIGDALGDLAIHLLDGRLRPVPPGLVGEIYVAGAGLARGYHGRPGKTSERFVPDPFSDVPGARMYRSGDLARVGAYGLEYCGRSDAQVKVRGFRIELGELESVALAVPGVSLAAVDVRGDRLVMWYVVSEGFEPSAVTRALQEACRSRLPPYSVPSTWITQTSMPLNVNGKLDRKALVLPAAGPAPEKGVAAVTEVGASVSRMVAELLELDSVEPTADLYDLGWHSLLLSRLTVRIQRDHGVDVALADLMNHATVEGIAGLVDAAVRAGRPSSAPAPVRRADRSRFVATVSRDGTLQLPEGLKSERG